MHFSLREIAILLEKNYYSGNINEITIFVFND